ncbi:MAG: GUN4 domain-containing protein [Rivularia sp. (in: Bacteria)]|nr:GUN4 domain-containing protein [Rivularia sp. MS3]
MSVCIESVKHFLVRQEWKKADFETEKLIFSFCNYTGQEYLKLEDIDLIPLNILAHLENLWTTHSKGRFGFRTQEKIHNSIRKQIRLNPRESLQRMISNVMRGSNDSMNSKEVLMVPYFYGVEIGWIEGHPMDSLGAYGKDKSYEELTFDLSAPLGHLPCQTWWTLNHQTTQVPFNVLFKKYGIIGLPGCAIKYQFTLQLHLFKRIQIACQQFTN